MSQGQELQNPPADAFHEGQVFIGEYPPEAAAWCNNDPENRFAIAEDGFEDNLQRWKIINWKKERSIDTLWSELREARNIKLENTDKYMTEDYPIEQDLKGKIKIYRRELRNLTRRDGAPWDGGGSETPWPTNPLE